MAFLVDGWPHVAWPDAPWQEDILTFASQILAGHCETFLVNAWPATPWPGFAWPDALWPYSPWPEDICWQDDTACHVALARWLGMAWQTMRLDPASPFSWQLSLLASRITRRFWPDKPWQNHDWQDAATTGQEQAFAEEIAIRLKDLAAAFAPILAIAAPAKEERKFPGVQESALGSRLPALHAWPDAAWPDRTWLSGHDTAQEQLLAENVPIERDNPRNSSQTRLAEKIPVNVPEPQPAAQSQALTAATRYRDAWPHSPWLDNAWRNFRKSGLFATRLYGRKFPENPHPCCQGALQIQTFATDTLAPDCNFAPSGLFPTFAGNEPRFTAWTDGAWPAHTWDKILGYQRVQAPFTITVQSEFLEV